MYLTIEEALAYFAKSIHEYSIKKGFWPVKQEAQITGNDAVSVVPTELVDESPVVAAHYARNFGEALMLVNTELAEAMEGFRKGIELDDPKEGALIEIGDAIIRLMDLGFGVGGRKFLELMVAKTKINDARPHLHGKKF